MKKYVNFRANTALLLIIAFFVNSLGPIPQARAQGAADLPVPGTMIGLTSAFEPVLIKGLKLHPENPFAFDFIVDTGNTKLSASDPKLKEESNKLIKYFLAAMTVPEKDLWVNLSPYEKNRMIADNLGQTTMGRDMLAQDYILKQLTASLIYPEKNLGKVFWEKVYAKSQEMYGTTQIPINTFNKVWIVADRADVFERGNVAYVVGAHLKVMLEEDYLALSKNAPSQTLPTKGEGIGSQIVRQIILPQLEREVNQGENFAPLRQIFYSMILASWYKMALKDAILTQIYGNQSKVRTGVNVPDPTEKEAIFQRYLQAYKKGVFNYIKDDVRADGQTIPRKYFSGGEDLRVLGDGAMLHRLKEVPQGANLVTGQIYDVSGPASIVHNAAMTVQEAGEAYRQDIEKKLRDDPWKSWDKNMVRASRQEFIKALKASGVVSLSDAEKLQDSYLPKDFGYDGRIFETEGFREDWNAAMMTSQDRAKMFGDRETFRTITFLKYMMYCISEEAKDISAGKRKILFFKPKNDADIRQRVKRAQQLLKDVDFSEYTWEIKTDGWVCFYTKANEDELNKLYDRLFHKEEKIEELITEDYQFTSNTSVSLSGDEAIEKAKLLNYEGAFSKSVQQLNKSLPHRVLYFIVQHFIKNPNARDRIKNLGKKFLRENPQDPTSNQDIQAMIEEGLHALARQVTITFDEDRAMTANPAIENSVQIKTALSEYQNVLKLFLGPFRSHAVGSFERNDVLIRARQRLFDELQGSKISLTDTRNFMVNAADIFKSSSKFYPVEIKAITAMTTMTMELPKTRITLPNNDMIKSILSQRRRLKGQIVTANSAMVTGSFLKYRAYINKKKNEAGTLSQNVNKGNSEPLQRGVLYAVLGKLIGGQEKIDLEELLKHLKAKFDTGFATAELRTYLTVSPESRAALKEGMVKKEWLSAKSRLSSELIDLAIRNTFVVNTETGKMFYQKITFIPTKISDWRKALAGNAGVFLVDHDDGMPFDMRERKMNAKNYEKILIPIQRIFAEDALKENPSTIDEIIASLPRGIDAKRINDYMMALYYQLSDRDLYKKTISLLMDILPGLENQGFSGTEKPSSRLGALAVLEGLGKQDAAGRMIEAAKQGPQWDESFTDALTALEKVLGLNAAMLSDAPGSGAQERFSIICRFIFSPKDMVVMKERLDLLRELSLDGGKNNEAVLQGIFNISNRGTSLSPKANEIAGEIGLLTGQNKKLDERMAMIIKSSFTQPSGTQKMFYRGPRIILMTRQEMEDMPKGHRLVAINILAGNTIRGFWVNVDDMFKVLDKLKAVENNDVLKKLKQMSREIITGKYVEKKLNNGVREAAEKTRLVNSNGKVLPDAVRNAAIIEASLMQHVKDGPYVVTEDFRKSYEFPVDEIQKALKNAAMSSPDVWLELVPMIKALYKNGNVNLNDFERQLMEWLINKGIGITELPRPAAENDARQEATSYFSIIQHKFVDRIDAETIKVLINEGLEQENRLYFMAWNGSLGKRNGSPGKRKRYDLFFGKDGSGENHLIIGVVPDEAMRADIPLNGVAVSSDTVEQMLTALKADMQQNVNEGLYPNIRLLSLQQLSLKGFKETDLLGKELERSIRSSMKGQKNKVFFRPKVSRGKKIWFLRWDVRDTQEVLRAADEWMKQKSAVSPDGGIDLTRSQVNVSKEGQGVQMQFDPAMIARIKRDGFDGMEFKIESIVPVNDLAALLGLARLP